MQSNYLHLADLAKKFEYRESIKLDDFKNVKKYLDSFHEVKEEDLCNLYHSVRFLRNTCINSKKNQDIILSANLLPAFINILKKLLDMQLVLKKEMLLKCNKVCMEFLGNLVVQNNAAVKSVWDLCSSYMLFHIMSNMDSHGKDITCMVLFNCLKEREELFEKEDDMWLLISIIEHCINYEDAEWGIFVIQLVIRCKNFTLLYKNLIDYPEYRLFLLDVLLEDLNCCKYISKEETFLFFAENFESKSLCIMMLVAEDCQQFHEESLLLYKTLSLLCEATSHVKFTLLRQKKSLMQCALGLLKNIASMDLAVNINEKSPTFGFKRDLIRLIGNMSYQNEAIQNEVHDSGGIPLILNACSIDEKNPYIMQWSIFATRNLCEGNVRNQRVIKELEQQGLASNDILTDSHVCVKIIDGKVKLGPIDYT
ncbi:ataxin-10 isoform X2 [Hydra vulgaris]|uniref:Ataxin-10 n=1 Tax=Hydra vulgaris TaxID=6087 RepID=A0ABM4D8Y0_HYDVU